MQVKIVLRVVLENVEVVKVWRANTFLPSAVCHSPTCEM